LCSNNKKRDDEIKLWRETNDGMYWVRKLRQPEKEEFTIIGIQVAGNIYLFNLLKFKLLLLLLLINLIL
jgi:hypothetical protein